MSFGDFIQYFPIPHPFLLELALTRRSHADDSSKISREASRGFFLIREGVDEW
jgi:hypothetical protein